MLSVIHSEVNVLKKIVFSLESYLSLDFVTTTTFLQNNIKKKLTFASLFALLIIVIIYVVLMLLSLVLTKSLLTMRPHVSLRLPG